LNEESKKSCRDNVVSMIALKENSVDKCSELDDVEKIFCREQVVYKKAMEQENAEVCNMLEINQINEESTQT